MRGEPRGVPKMEKRRREKPAKAVDNMAVAVEPMPVQAVATDFDLISVAKNGGSVPDSATKLGDCIDCKQCVKVCPAGIDIRNGIQLECVQCTACIDACDDTMDKIGKPRGLIRYSSYEGIKNKKGFRFNGRMAFYSTVLTLLLTLFVTLLAMRSPTESILLRAPGTLFQTLPDGGYSNIYTAKILNKTFDLMQLEVKVLEPAGGEVMPINKLDVIEPQTVLEGRFFVKLPKDAVKSSRTNIVFGVFADGKQIETVKSTFIGPEQ
jgi:cytochrome c oxidase accessory protein FixG